MSNRDFLPQHRQDAALAMQPSAIAPAGSDVFYDDDLEDGISIASILTILWERKWWIAIAALLGTIAALSYSLLQTPMYRATATIELNPPTVPILSAGGQAGEDLVVPTTDRQFQETQLGILKSRALAERVVQDLGLNAENASGTGAVSPEALLKSQASALADNISVQPSANSRLIALSYVSADPAEAARNADAFATSFIALTLDRKYAATASAREFLEERIASVREEINMAERKLVDYAKANGIVVLNGGDGGGEAGSSTLTGDSLASLNSALAAAQQKRIAAEQRFRQAGSLSQGTASSAALRAQKAALEASYEEKSTYLQPTFPEMVRIKTQIDELDRQIRAENSRTSGTFGGEYRAALAEEQALRSRVAQLSGSALQEREDAIQYNILQRELDTGRSLYDALLERYNEVGVVEGVGAPQAAIVDNAEVPVVPFEPSILRNSILGLLVGLFIGGGLAVAYEKFTDTLKTKDDMTEKLGIAALGMIPNADSNEELIEGIQEKSSRIYDAYATLRTNLDLSQSGGFPKILVVTSARPEEGKSSTSYAMALQLADTGNRVLLIDADMRRPSFVGSRGSETGLSALLTSDASLGDHIGGTTNANLVLMQSGPIPPNPATIIGSARLNAILNEARTLFDHVIIDAPPVAGFADAALLGSCSDGVLFVIESGVTRAATALSALSQLRVSGISILGGALTKTSARIMDYGSYGYYYGSEARSDATRISLIAHAEDEDEAAAS